MEGPRTPGSRDRPAAPVPSADAARAPSRNVRRRRYARRAFLALAAIALAELVGTVGFHAIEGVGWVNAFYFESMLATGQGPPFALQTNTGKIFASIMGFVSVGSTLSAVVFTLGPLLARIWRGFVLDLEGGARRLEKDLAHEVRRLEDELR